MNYDPKENDLLRIASAHEQFCRESSSALQIAAALIAIAGLIIACVFVLHIGGISGL